MDLPLDSSPWQKRAGAQFSHIACPRPPQSYNGCLDCPWFVRQTCILDTERCCIQHPIRGAAEFNTLKKILQMHAQRRCALSGFCCPTRSGPVPLTDSVWLVCCRNYEQGARSLPWKLRYFDYWPRLPNFHVRVASFTFHRLLLWEINVEHDKRLSSLFSSYIKSPMILLK